MSKLEIIITKNPEGKKPKNISNVVFNRTSALFSLKTMKNFIKQKEKKNHQIQGTGWFRLLERTSSLGTPEQAP